ncbi:hypothetical protein GLOIN_2v1786842 [Rhizophagus clarus]|uniref:Uncharacterized protein n=1 Tax=Rhizophagus clarus TaxID=94130 RepID=A0A8H3L7T1_9GLOM|nr:hypothetical protein GLOIN_2v1786842 [Rhizophagus clarus]
MATDEIHLLTYSDLLGISTEGRKPNWYKWIKQHCIINIVISRKIKLKFIINRQYYLQGSKVSDKNLRKKQWIYNINDNFISSSVQVPVLIRCTGYELKNIQSRSKRKTANNRCLLFIDKEKTINVKAQSIQDVYILDSSVFEYIAIIENRIILLIHKKHLLEIQENPLVIKAELTAIIMALLCLNRSTRLIRFKDLVITLQKVKAHDFDDHNNIVDKLIKEACNKECLVIDLKLFAHNSIICWNYKPIERNITLMDNINIDHNNILIKIDNLNCWNSSNIGILCLTKEIIPKSFSEFLKELKIPKQNKYKIMREVIDTLVLQFKHLIWEHHNIQQIKLEQSHSIDSRKKKLKFVGIKGNNRIKGLNSIFSKYKIWIYRYFNMDGHWSNFKFFVNYVIIVSQ